MAVMTYAKFHSNQLMLTLSFGVWTSEAPLQAWQSTEKAGPDRVNPSFTKVGGGRADTLKVFLR